MAAPALESRAAKQHLHAQRIWDRHGEYQSTYYPDAAKQLISHFLADKITGRNLDVGGGCFSAHPNSIVLDVSLASLRNNRIKDKVQFYADNLQDHLPFADNSFSSATMVSVWQYVREVKPLMRELERVIMPAGELHIITQAHAGFPEHIKRSPNAIAVQDDVQQMGYDSIIENIPFGEQPFQCVSVAMPGENLFGRTPSHVAHRKAREEEDLQRKENKYEFFREYVAREIERADRLLGQLATYPVTVHSKEYLARVQEFAEELRKETGTTPVLYFKELPILLEMLLAGSEQPFVFMLPGDPEANYRSHKELFAKYGLQAQHAMELGTPEEMITECTSLRRTDQHGRLDRYLQLLGGQALNSATRDLQEQLQPVLQRAVPDLGKRLRTRALEQIYDLVVERKQERKIENLLMQKEKILAGGAEIISTGAMSYRGIAALQQERIMKHIQQSAYDWETLQDDC